MQLSVAETFIDTLRMLDALLAKAAEQRGNDAEDLIGARLAPDMYPLATQVCFAVYQALEIPHRLRGEPVPESVVAHVMAGLDPDNPGTLAAARARVADAIAILETAPAANPTPLGDAMVRIEQPNGTFAMTGEQYVRDWAMHQFYFHVMTAYAILRAAGIAIGKADYMPFARFKVA